MAEDLPSRELVEELIERLEHLERVLQNNTMRLHAVERRLGVDGETTARTPPRRPLYETLGDERDEPRPHADEGRPAATTSEPTPPPAGATHAPPNEAAPPDTQTPPATQTPPTTQTTTQAQAQPEAEARRGAAGPGHLGADEARSWAQGAARERGWEGESAAGEWEGGDEDDERGAGPTQGRPLESPVPPEPPRARRDLESFVGGSLFAWVGIIAGAVAAALFLKEAFERQWIGPSMRVTIGAAAGVALLGLGERLRGRGLRQYAFILSGGGVLILYLSIYAAFNFYQLVSQPVAFLLMALVTATAVSLSVRLNALAIAVLGLLGGFATPLLLSTGQDNQVALFTYVALLDAGVLAVAYFKRWRSLNFISFFATVLMTLGWLVIHYRPEKLWTTVFFLSVFFALYSLLAVVHNLLPRRPARWYDILLVSANATVHFGLSYTLLVDAGHARATPATHALLLFAAYALLYFAVRRLNREDRLLTYGFVGAAVTFLTVAAAIQLELHWVTIAWAVEGLALTWAGLRANEKALRQAALVVTSLAVAHWLGWDMPGSAFAEGAAFVPLVNRRALSCAILIATMFASARQYRRAAGVDEQESATFNTFFVLMGNALALTLLTIDVNDYFARRLASAGAEQPGDHYYDFDNYRGRIENARQFSVSVLWTFYGATALVFGILRRITLLRYGALLLLAACAAKVLVVDAAFYAAAWHVPVFNHTFTALALLALALAACARFYRHADGVRDQERRVAPAVLLVAANLLALGALSLEAVGYYDRAAAQLVAANAAPSALTQLNEGKAFALSVIWTLYGAAALLYGQRRDARAWRYGGLLLLTGTAVKLLVWDLRFYDAAWHAPALNRTFVAFALLVAALWLVVRGYARSERIPEDELTARPFFTVLANVLAVVALSAEASGHFAARMTTRTLAAESPRDLQLAQQLALSVIWATYGGALLVVGRLRRSRLLRVMSLVLLGLTTLKVFFWDLSSLDRVYRIISFIVLGAILLAVSYLYQKSQQQQRAAETE